MERVPIKDEESMSTLQLIKENLDAWTGDCDSESVGSIKGDAVETKH